MVSLSDRLREKLGAVPHRPGVYLMRDRFGTVIYVGKARDLRRRVSQYFHPSRRMSWDRKLNALIEAIHDFEIVVVRGEPEALLLEGRLIKEYKPRYNVSFRDDKRFLMLKVNLNDPIPRFSLTRIRTGDGAQYFGPFSNSGALRRSLELARQKFHLRACRALTPGVAEHKHCLYAHLQVCSAPCVGQVTREEYRGQVAAACEFLLGRSEQMIEEMEAEMQKAAGQLDYERAAKLRNQIEDLRVATRKTTTYQRLPGQLRIHGQRLDPAADLKELSRILGLKAPPGRIEGFDISNISGTFLVASMVVFNRGRPARAEYRRFKMKSVGAQDDFACMAETVRRRYVRVLAEGKCLPDLILVDGGKGQLNAARAELMALKVGHIPIVGLAKEFEEIHLPGKGAPLRLDKTCGALKLLQRVRDESHRFANAFNASLRTRRISESMLDECPGIGSKRKAALLRHFGSLHRLRQASAGDLLAVEGFGRASALALHAFLKARPG